MRGKFVSKIPRYKIITYISFKIVKQFVYRSYAKYTPVNNAYYSQFELLFFYYIGEVLPYFFTYLFNAIVLMKIIT